MAAKYNTGWSDLYHHGIRGMKWGVRRYQNADGTLTAAGKEHYKKKDEKWLKKNDRNISAQLREKTAGDSLKYMRSMEANPDNYDANGKLKTDALAAYVANNVQLMNQHVDNIKAPSGRGVRAVADILTDSRGKVVGFTNPYLELEHEK